MAQRFILQMLVALFAEDIDLLPKYFVTQLLEDCSTPAERLRPHRRTVRGHEHQPAANRRAVQRRPLFQRRPVSRTRPLEIQDLELVLLRKAAKFDWSKVQPEIFGTLFQHSMDDEERHAFGAHFTSPSDIMKIVKPTIVEPWREQIESAKTLQAAARTPRPAASFPRARSRLRLRQLPLHRLPRTETAGSAHLRAH